MPRDVSVLQGVCGLCCGQRRVALPPPQLPKRRFTWTEHYTSDAGDDARKDVNSIIKDYRVASRAFANSDSGVETEDVPTSDRPCSTVEASDLSRPQSPQSVDSEREVEQSSGKDDEASCSAAASSAIFKRSEHDEGAAKPRRKRSGDGGEVEQTSGKQEGSRHANSASSTSSVVLAALTGATNHHIEEAPSGAEDQRNTRTKMEHLGGEAEKKQQIQEKCTPLWPRIDAMEDLKRAATFLEGPVQKYPKSGRGILKSPQDRYIAVLPKFERSQTSEMSSIGTTASMMSDRSTWSGSSNEPDIGSLAYWADQDDFLSNGPPKGLVPLSSIRKVSFKDSMSSRMSARSVHVKHKCDKRGGDKCDMVLVFPTKRCAEEWCHTFSEFLVLLRRLHGLA